MSLTKDLYDVGDRIIARIPGYALNYFGTVTRVLTRGGYTIRYDNGNSLPTNHDQILGLTYEYNENWPNAVQNNNVPGYLPQRVSREFIETIKRIAGNPVTKTEYLEKDRVIVRYEDTIDDGNYTGTVKRGLKNGFYIIEYAGKSACPCEHIQILGLTDEEPRVDPIPDSELRMWLQQREIIPPGPPVPPDIHVPKGGSKEQPNQWFNTINIPNKVFRSEKEVEIFFVTPFLGLLGYHDINADMSFRVKNFRNQESVIKLDFALFKYNDIENNRPILIVEAKRPGLFRDPRKVKDAQGQLRYYAFCLRCHFGLLTDSKTIQIIDFSNFNNEVYHTYNRDVLENVFADIYDKISKKSLTSYYEKLPQNAGGF